MVTHTPRTKKSELVREIGVPDDFIIITPTDAADIPGGPVRAIRVDTDCTLNVVTAGSPTTQKNMKFKAGETRDCYIIQVYNTGTTGGVVIEGML